MHQTWINWTTIANPFDLKFKSEETCIIFSLKMANLTSLFAFAFHPKVGMAYPNEFICGLVVKAVHSICKPNVAFRKVHHYVQNRESLRKTNSLLLFYPMAHPKTMRKNAFLHFFLFFLKFWIELSMSICDFKITSINKKIQLRIIS